ncbi:tyrosine-type recombinase/integrase [Mesorhizobium helmanticense]|uniref:Integrase n=1 Tax=Mesorhizobium helmanticense TaxID=1776423 RepID=A0A2T4J2K5_9HYPH|nr:integrase arm-type DNA-binding domain-containing protein [Mesorhizobium helmanticense]PTE12132.1 integrase [Mesorhizobium helmanticense]
MLYLSVTLYFMGLEMKLTDTQCRGAKAREKPWNLTDGHGLFLLVKPNGSKLWRCDFAFNGKRSTANFGPYPDTSLAGARELRDDLKRKVKAGINPVTKVEESRPTFEQIAREWFKTNEAKWKPSYSTRFWKRIEVDIFPAFGGTAIAEVKPPVVLTALRMVEEREAIYTARRVHQFVSVVFKYAIAAGLAERNPAADLHGALKPVPKEKHRSALKETELPTFFARLAGTPMDEATRLGLKAVAHVFVRTAEIRFAKWPEFDFDRDIWTIPALRMKMKRELRVPLSRQAKAVFLRLRELANGAEWVLPGPYRLKPISENCLLYALYRCGYHGRATVHGFRSTFSTIANESETPAWDRDAIEHQLAHAPDDAIRATYDRGERWQTRTRMMQWYSDLLDKHEKVGEANDLTDLLGY